MKNKLFTKLGIATLGFAMAVVTGAAIQNAATETKAADSSTVTMNITAKTGVVSGKSISWTSDPITFTNNQGSSTSAIRISDSDHYRLYAKSDASLTCNNGDITKVVFTATSADYATALKTSLANSNYSTATTSGSTVTVSNISTPEITISSFSAQTRINKIVVTYSTSSTDPDTPVDPEPEEPTNPTSDVVDTLTRDTTGVTSQSYTEWSNKTVESDAVYAGKSAGSNSSIQLNSTNPYGIVSTKSGGTLKHVAVVWNSNTANGRTLQVYGSNTAYSGSADLYNTSTDGDKLGTIVYGTSTELTITEDYKFIGLRSSSGAMYLTSISITWEVEETGQTETLKSIYVSQNPAKTQYAVGEKFNSNGLTVMASFKETGVEDKITNDYELDLAEEYVFTASDIGTKTVTVTSTENQTIKTTFNLTITDIIPSKLSHSGVKFLSGKKLSEHIGEFTVTYTDGSQKLLRLGDEGLKIFESPDTNIENDVEITNLDTLADTFNGIMVRITYTENDVTVSPNRFTLETTSLISYKIVDKPEYILNDAMYDDVELHYTSYIGQLDIEVSSSSENLVIEYDSSLHEFDEETGEGIALIGIMAPTTAAAGQYNVSVTLSSNGNVVSTSFPVLVRTEAPSEGGDGESSYSLVENLKDITTGTYLIAAKVSGTYYYMDSIGGKKPTSSTNIGDALEFDIVNKGSSKFTIKHENSYLIYKSSTDLGSQSGEYLWKISAGTKGTLRVLSNDTATRGIFFRANDNNIFGGYAASNVTDNGTEYYDIELFKKEETIEKTAFDYVNDFVNNFMHMNDINIADGSLTTACLTYYSQAKVGFNAMKSSYTGDEDLVNVFQTSFADAYQRYMAWATANGDTQPFTGSEIVKSSMNLLDNLSNGNSNMTIIIITSAITVLSTFFLYTFARKTKKA